MTGAEASAIIQQAVNSGYDGSSACIYSATGSNSDDPSKQTVVRFAAGAQTDYDQATADLAGAQDVNGVGDAAACETNRTGPRFTVFSRKAGQVITITGASCDLDKQFAMKVLSRL